MGQEHYLSKIERNAYVLEKAPLAVKERCLADIKWARELASRLDLLEYAEREKAISEIHRVLDEDYAIMGFEEDEKITKKN